MIWVMYGGIIAGVVLMLAALIVVIPPIVRTQRHAKAIAPNELIAKFQKAQDDFTRVQGSTALLEELVVRAREAIERLNAALQTLRGIVPSR